MQSKDLISLMNEIDDNSDELVKLHQNLIKIQSVNSGYMPTGNETEVVDYCTKWLANFGARTLWPIANG